MPDSSQQHRHRCEVRQLIRWRAERGRDWVLEYVAGVSKIRGKPAADRLHSDAAEQWARGNRGERGDWR